MELASVELVTTRGVLFDRFDVLLAVNVTNELVTLLRSIVTFSMTLSFTVDFWIVAFSMLALSATLAMIVDPSLVVLPNVLFAAKLSLSMEWVMLDSTVTVLSVMLMLE